MTYPLPQPTTDLDLAKRHLDEYGYCLLKDALSPEEVDVLRSRVLEQLEAEMQLGVNNRVRPDKKQLVKFLINKGRVFRDMIFHPGLHALLDHVLGTEYLLSSYHAHIAHPGSTKAFHTDQFWMPPPTNERKQTLVKPGSVTRARNRGHHVGGEAMIAPNTISPAVVCNAMWMLDEYTEANGATLLVPGSHLSGRQPDHELDSNANWVPATGPAGTAVVFEGRTWCRVPQVSGISARPTRSVARRVPAGNGGPIAKGRNAATGSVGRALRETPETCGTRHWHSTGANTTERPRIGLSTNFCAPQFRQQENFLLGTRPEVLQDASPELLDLIGFKAWQGYGGYENTNGQWVARVDCALGELQPEREST